MEDGRWKEVGGGRWMEDGRNADWNHAAARAMRGMPQGGMANYIIRSFLELGLVDIRTRHSQTQEGEKKDMLGHLCMNLCKA